MSEPAFVQSTPEQIAAVKRRAAVADIPKVLIPALDAVWGFIRSNNLGFGLNVAIYRHLGDKTVDMTCGVEVEQPFEQAGEVVRDYTPAGEAVRGQNHRRRAGVNWEVYGHWTDDTAKLETEVYMLLKAT